MIQCTEHYAVKLFQKQMYFIYYLFMINKQSFQVDHQIYQQKQTAKNLPLSNLFENKTKSNPVRQIPQKKIKHNFTEKLIHLRKYDSVQDLLANMNEITKKHLPHKDSLNRTPKKKNVSGITQSKSKQKNGEKYKKILNQTTSTSTGESWKMSGKTIPSFLKAKKQEKISSNVRKFQLSDFVIIKKIGEGKFGKVFMVKEKRTGFISALKVIEKKLIIEQGIEQFIQQIKIQSFLSHPNIIQIYGMFHDQKYAYIIIQLGSDGHLYEFMQNNKRLSEEGTSIIIRSLLRAARFFHSNDIIHRDIKPQNIVITAGTVKICDFGWACKKSHNTLRSTLCGTPLYLSPEILKNQGYDQKADLWAIGVLAYQLQLGFSPFKIKNKNQLSRIVTNSVEFPLGANISTQFQQFIKVILNKNPEQRQSCTKLLSMQFIKIYNGLDTCQQLCK